MSSFWTEADERHKEIAETYYKNIEQTHPERVTSRGMCVCLDYTNWCEWAASSVNYYKYNGPRVTNI